MTMSVAPGVARSVAVPRSWEAHAATMVEQDDVGCSLMPSAAACVRLGCLFEAQPSDTFGLLVMRMRPRRGVIAVVHDTWADLAPSLFLLSGRTSGHARGGSTRRRGARIHLGWERFALAYRAELDALPARIHRELLWQIGCWLDFHHTVTILSHERVLGGDELHAPTQRRILREWLLGLRGQMG
jgi:hypothetical protein